jgi:hypothetical protein
LLLACITRAMSSWHPTVSMHQEMAS